MGNKISIIIFFFFVICFTVFSCEKDKGNEQKPISEEFILTSVIPNSGYIGQRVIITGTGISKNIQIFFDQKRANIIELDDKQVIVEVPDVQVYGEIAVVGRVDKEESNKLRFNNKKKEEEEDPDRVFDSQGHEIHPQSLELTFLKRTGPFTLLQDGNIFTVAEGGSTASISMDKGMNWDTYSLFDPTRFSALSPVVIQTKKGTIIVGFSNGREISPLNWNKTTHTYNVNAKLPTYIIYSTDNGKKWSNPIKLHDDWTGMN